MSDDRVGELEERIEALERRVEQLEGQEERRRQHVDRLSFDENGGGQA